MKKFMVVLGVVLVLAVAGLAGGYIWLSSYVGSDAFRAQVETQVSKALGAEVKIGGIGLSWKGLALERLRIPNPTPFDAQNAFFSLDRGGAEIVWQSLLEDTVQVTRVELEAPVLTLYQNSAGAMALPFAKKASGEAPAPGGEAGGGKEVAVEEIVLTRARVQGFDAAGEQMFLVEDAVLTTGYRRGADGKQSGQGELKIGKLVAGAALTLTGLQSPVVVEGDRIDLPAITGKAYSGSAAANSFSMELKLGGMNLAELMAGMQAGAEAGGAVDFALDVKGSLDAPKDLAGPGSFVVTGIETAQLKGMQGKQEGLGGLLTLLSLIPRIAEPLGQVAGAVSGISVLKEGKIDSATGEFQMGRQKMEYSKLFVDAGEVDIELKGNMTFASELDLHGDVVLGPELAGAVAGLISGQSGGDAREQRLPLSITGSSSAPKIRINPTKALIETGTQLLDRFFRPQQPASEGGNATAPLSPPPEQKPLLPDSFKGLFQ